MFQKVIQQNWLKSRFVNQTSHSKLHIKPTNSVWLSSESTVGTVAIYQLTRYNTLIDTAVRTSSSSIDPTTLGGSWSVQQFYSTLVYPWPSPSNQQFCEDLRSHNIWCLLRPVTCKIEENIATSQNLWLCDLLWHDIEELRRICHLHIQGLFSEDKNSTFLQNIGILL
jgi:hypothetical protein